MTHFQLGRVYHQEYTNGDRAYFQVMAEQKNGRYRGFRVEGRRAPKLCSCDATIPGWIETPANEIPKQFISVI